MERKGKTKEREGKGRKSSHTFSKIKKVLYLLPMLLGTIL
jgi:hypothetical protein